MKSYRPIVLLGAVWLVLGCALGAGLQYRLNLVGSAATALTRSELPLVINLMNLRDELTSTQLSCRRVTAGTVAAEVAQERIHAQEGLRAIRTIIDRSATAARASGLHDRFSWCLETIDPWIAAAQRSIDAPNTTDAERAVTFAANADSFDRASERLGSLIGEDLIPRMDRRAVAVDDLISSTRMEAFILIAMGILTGSLLTGLVARSVHAQEKTRRSLHERQEFTSRVTDALAMAQTEAQSLALVEEIIERVQPGACAELLVADSSRAHLHQAAATDACREVGSLCGVKLPGNCPAVRRGFAATFASSTEFDACPHLRGRSGGPCSATCVPLSIMGQQVGVLHVVTPDRQPLETDIIARLTTVTAKVGERIGFIRAFSKSEDQAAKDTLTGLLNRRSAEQAVQHLQRLGSSFCVVYADIDHFKRLNDTHGHETGDRALRLFSRVLTESLRPTDIVSRWGGEEFVLLLPSTTPDAARAILDRLREAIVRATSTGTIPPFTASFGVAECMPVDQFDERLEVADAALLMAKRTGRNRVVLEGTEMSTVAPKTSIGIRSPLAVTAAGAASEPSATTTNSTTPVASTAGTTPMVAQR